MKFFRSVVTCARRRQHQRPPCPRTPINDVPGPNNAVERGRGDTGGGDNGSPTLPRSNEALEAPHQCPRRSAERLLMAAATAGATAEAAAAARRQRFARRALADRCKHRERASCASVPLWTGCGRVAVHHRANPHPSHPRVQRNHDHGSTDHVNGFNPHLSFPTGATSRVFGAQLSCAQVSLLTRRSDGCNRCGSSWRPCGRGCFNPHRRCRRVQPYCSARCSPAHPHVSGTERPPAPRPPRSQGPLPQSRGRRRD